jgi:hypothetical protein
MNERRTLFVYVFATDHQEWPKGEKLVHGRGTRVIRDSSSCVQIVEGEAEGS